MRSRDVIAFVGLVLGGCSSRDSAPSSSASPDGASPLDAPLRWGHVEGRIHGSVTGGGRLIAGIGSRFDHPNVIHCDKLLVREDRVVPSLPQRYNLTLTAPEGGDYILVGMLITNPPPVRAPMGFYLITLDHEGIHYNSPNSTPYVDIVFEGSMEYVCP